MINGGEEYSCNGLIPVKSSCIGIIPVKELGPGGHVFLGRSSFRAVFTCISVRYQVKNIFVNCSRVHIIKKNQRQIAFSITWIRQEPCGLVGSSVISDPGFPGSNSTAVNSFCVTLFSQSEDSKKIHSLSHERRWPPHVRASEVYKNLPADFYRVYLPAGYYVYIKPRVPRI